jgi:hypothetical protein
VRTERLRDLSAGLTALVAHILFLTLAPQKPLEEPKPPPIADVAADTTIDIDSNPPGPERAASLPATRLPSEITPPAQPRAEMAQPPPSPAAPTPTPAPAPEEEAESEPEDAPEKPPSPVAEGPKEPETGPVKPGPETPPADEYGALPPVDPGPAVPGLSGPLWSVPGVVPSTALPKPAPTTIAAAPAVPSDVASRVLSGTVHSRDQAVGIEVPAAGVVATSVADAMRHSALTDVKGTFEVKLSGEGAVESVRFIGSSDGDASQWAAVAESAKKALAGRALQMGPDKQGVTVVVKVESKLQFPNGAKQRIDVRPVCANEVIEQAITAIEGVMQTGGMVRGVRDDQGKFIPYNELDDESRRKFCIPIGIRGQIDPSNIGAHMTNSVRTSFQIKRAGERALPSEAAMPIDRGVPWLPVADGKTRPPPPPPKKKLKKKPRRGSVAPVQMNETRK